MYLEVLAKLLPPYLLIVDLVLKALSWPPTSTSLEQSSLLKGPFPGAGLATLSSLILRTMSTRGGGSGSATGPADRRQGHSGGPLVPRNSPFGQAVQG